MARSTPSRLVELALDAKAALGEGPVWHMRRRRLYWVDILGCKIHDFNPATGRDRTFSLDQFPGCVVARHGGGLMLGLQHGFACFNLRTRKVRHLCDPDATRPGNRFNDGKCDPAGRFWAGTMDMDARPRRGSLFCLDTDLSVHRVRRNLSISNGLAWSLDSRTLYFIDSTHQKVWAFDYEPESGRIWNRRVAIEIPKRQGVPDGMTIDSEGMLWVALWGGGRVMRCDPQTGSALEIIQFPVSLVTSCTFGGPKLDELFVTSARTSLDPAALKREPHAGGLFSVHPGVSGLPASLFAG